MLFIPLLHPRVQRLLDIQHWFDQSNFISLELHHKADQQVSWWTDYTPPSLCLSKALQGEDSPSGGLWTVRAGPGFCRVERSLLIKAEPWESLGGAGHYSPWSYCRAVSLGSQESGRQARLLWIHLPSKGGTTWMAQEDMNAEWMWNEMMAVEGNGDASICMTLALFTTSLFTLPILVCLRLW